MTKEILILPGDGIGQEVTSSAKEVLDYLIGAHNLEFNITEMEAPINILPGEIQTSGGVSTPGAPGAPVSIVPATPTVNIIPLQKIAQISETSNKIMDPRVPTAVKKSKVKLLKVKEA